MRDNSDIEDFLRNDWGVVHCIRTEEEEEARVLRLRILHVPESIGKKHIKTALERAGRFFGEGEYRWGNHSVLPHDEWVDQEQAAAETITYTDLLDEAKGEKRVTLRFPIGLHTALVKAASGKSFNQFCVDIMASAIGYEQEPLAPALPRLAQMQGISEVEMTARMQKMSNEARKTQASPLRQKLGHHFGNIAGLPPEQQKQMSMGVVDNPEFLQVYQKAIQANLSEEQLAEMSRKLGLSIDETRQRLEKQRALPIDFLEKGLRELKEASPEQVKDIHLMLRDVFTRNTAATQAVSDVPETEFESSKGSL